MQKNNTQSNCLTSFLFCNKKGNLLFCLLACFLFARADKYPKNTDIDVRHYAFKILLSDNNNEISASATIRILFLKAGINNFRLDLVNLKDSLKGKGMIVESVEEGKSKTSFTHQNNALIVSLTSPVTKDEEREFTLQYHGIPLAGLLIGPDKNGDRGFFSMNWPNQARNWLPSVDNPYDKATSEFMITAPAYYQVISNGLKIEETDLKDNQRLTHWKQSVPVSVWLFVLGVAKYSVKYEGEFMGKSIQTWVYAKEREAGFYDFGDMTQKSLRFFSQYVGPYAYEKLANIEAAHVGGGMESSSAILYDEKLYKGTANRGMNNIVVHEIAHQWFGNAVTESSWDDVWLSEGFATYFTLLFNEHNYGREDFVSGLLEAKKRVFDFYKKNPSYAIVFDNTAEIKDVTTSQTYQKGAWILHMLRNLMGDEAFQKGIQSYYHRYMNANATTTDFRNEMEKASGKDLKPFFAQWLYKGGNIILKAKWSYDAVSKMVNIDLAQIQNDGFVFDTPIEIGVYQEGKILPILQTIQLNVLQKRFSIPANAKPDKLSIDPRTILLAQWELEEEK